jgi:glycerol-3-phosphate dehydrogenase
VFVSRRGLVTIAGGKWTTYRSMAEDTVDRALETGGVPAPRSRTSDLAIRVGETDPWSNDPVECAAMGVENAGGPGIEEFVRGAVRDGMARTVEDVMARRSRALFLDARGSIAQARGVARALAAELGRDGAWVEAEVAAFTALASRWIPAS